MAHAEAAIVMAIGALNVRLRNHEDVTANLKYKEYPSLKSGISANRYIAQSTAGFADLFDNAPANISSI